MSTRTYLAGLLLGLNGLMAASFAIGNGDSGVVEADGYIHHGRRGNAGIWRSATDINSDINAAALNTTQVWQQQQAHQPWWTGQSAFVDPTAITTVTSDINAASINNGIQNPWQPNQPLHGCVHGCHRPAHDWWNRPTNFSGNASTNVNSDINAAAVNNTIVWQQQQSNQPWGVSQNAWVDPTAITTVTSDINAISSNNSGGWWPHGGFNSGNASTSVDSSIDAAAINNTQVWQQQQTNQPWGTSQNAWVTPTAVVGVDSSINAFSTNSNW